MTEAEFFQALKEGDLIKARKVLRGLERALPRTRTLFLQGILLENAGDFNSALQKYDLALVMHLSDPDIWFAKARTLDRLGRRDMAKRAVERAIKLSPRDPGPHVLNGRLLLNLKAYDLAMSEARTALDAAPENIGALLLYGILISLVEQDYSKALSQFDKVLTLDENNSEAWTNRGIVLRQIGDRDGSLYSLRRALTIDPTDSTATQVLVSMGRKDLIGSITLRKGDQLDRDGRSGSHPEDVSLVKEGSGTGSGPDDTSGHENGMPTSEKDGEVVEELTEWTDEEDASSYPDKRSTSEIELRCPRCGKAFKVRSGGRFACPGCGLQGEVD